MANSKFKHTDRFNLAYKSKRIILSLKAHKIRESNHLISI
jgi:hypothetical protein